MVSMIVVLNESFSWILLHHRVLTVSFIMRVNTGMRGQVGVIVMFWNHTIMRLVIGWVLLPTIRVATVSLPMRGATSVIRAASLLLPVEVFNGAERYEIHLLKIMVINDVSLGHDRLLLVIIRVISKLEVVSSSRVISCDFIKLLKL